MAPEAVASPRSFYRRPLPKPSVAFASAEGRALFAEALAEGHMAGYFALAEQFHTQSEPAFCGLGTLVVVLNALQIDPGRLWKGPWRWFGEELLDCCAPLEQIAQTGVSLQRLTCLARCNGAHTEVHSADTSDCDAFRGDLIKVTSQAGQPHMVVSYSRALLGQSGSGHYSPVAGYHQGKDMALILDVARFKYPPHWCPVEKLWAAMQTEDTETGQSRGYVLLSRNEHPPGLLAGLLKRPSERRSIDFDDPAQINAEVGEALYKNPNAGLLELAEALEASLVRRGIAVEAPQAGSSHQAAVEASWQALESTDTFGLLTRHLEGSPEVAATVSLIVLAGPHSLLEQCPAKLRGILTEQSPKSDASSPALQPELAWLRLQWDELARCP